MRPLYATTLTVALSLALSAGSQAAFGQAETTGPSAQEMKNSQDRGLYLGRIGGAATPSAPVIKVETINKTPDKITPIKTIPVKITPVKITPAKITPIKTQAKHRVTPIATHKADHHIKVTANTKVNANAAAPANTDEVYFEAWLNKPGKKPSYKNGEKMAVTLKAVKDCSITMFDYDGKGKLTRIFPNQYQQDNALKAGQTINVGGHDSPFEYQLSKKPNEKVIHERIFIFATPMTVEPQQQDASFAVAMNTNGVNEGPFRSVPMTLEQYRKLVNQSAVYNAREVKIVAKNTSSNTNADASSDAQENLQETALVSYRPSKQAGQAPVSMPNAEKAPNKMELGFTIE